MKLVEALARWPVVRQLTEGDLLGLGKAAQSQLSKTLRPRLERADHVVQSVCPYCAVGCGQLVYVEGGEVSHIEGDPASPISRGRLCPKGQASKSYVQSPLREYKVKYRPPNGTAWPGASACSRPSRVGPGSCRAPPSSNAFPHMLRVSLTAPCGSRKQAGVSSSL